MTLKREIINVKLNNKLIITKMIRVTNKFVMSTDVFHGISNMYMDSFIMLTDGYFDRH